MSIANCETSCSPIKVDDENKLLLTYFRFCHTAVFCLPDGTNRNAKLMNITCKPNYFDNHFINGLYEYSSFPDGNRRDGCHNQMNLATCSSDVTYHPGTFAD